MCFAHFQCLCLPGDPRPLRSRGGGDLKPAVARRDPGHHLQQVLSSRRRTGGCPPAGAGHSYRMDRLQQP